MKTILITGITGFVGRNTLSELLIKEDYKISALVRPNTDIKRYEEFKDKVEIIKIDLTDIEGLENFLSNKSYDVIIHIGAIRGGRKFSNKDYFRANVESVEQLAINAQKNSSKLIFCSSVGIFGAIPLELPANNNTIRQKDNYYHLTKIKAEEIIQKYVKTGLNAIIVRPAITYGKGDYGFPFTLIKLIDKKYMIYPKENIQIHMTNVHKLALSFAKLVETDFDSGDALIVADREPVSMHKLVNYISQEIHERLYPRNRRFSRKFFLRFENLARFFKNELWTSRFELISKSWFYDISTGSTDLNIVPANTIPDFKEVIDWYKTLKKET